MAVRSVVSLFVGVALVAGCSADKGFNTEKIVRSDYGDAWPLTADEAVLECGQGGGPPLVTVDGRTYGLGDWQDVQGKPPRGMNLTRIWARDDEGELISMQVLVDDALALCDD